MRDTLTAVTTGLAPESLLVFDMLDDKTPEAEGENECGDCFHADDSHRGGGGVVAMSPDLQRGRVTLSCRRTSCTPGLPSSPRGRCW